jgi:deoxyribonuclease V
MRKPRFLAGVDIAISPSKEECIGAVVLWDALLEIVLEEHVVRRPLGFPYVPGLLSFREAPAALAALRRLRQEPDVLLCDGQGYAHPRRFGLACHIGVLTDRPTIGCAKSVLVGGYENPGTTRGAASPLIHGHERVGTVLRTQNHIRPVFVSVGHRISLASAVGIVLRAAVRYRLPEPTRLADRLVAQAKSVERIT